MHSKELDEGKHLEFDTVEQGLGILWNVVDLYKDAESKINRSSYLVMALKFAKALEDEYDEHKSAAAAEEDWEYDTRHSGGSGGMDYSQFERSITELLEVWERWTGNTRVHLLRTAIIAVTHSPGQMGDLHWKATEDIQQIDWAAGGGGSTHRRGQAANSSRSSAAPHTENVCVHQGHCGPRVAGCVENVCVHQSHCGPKVAGCVENVCVHQDQCGPRVAGCVENVCVHQGHCGPNVAGCVDFSESGSKWTVVKELVQLPNGDSPVELLDIGATNPKSGNRNVAVKKPGRARAKKPESFSLLAALRKGPKFNRGGPPPAKGNSRLRKGIEEVIDQQHSVYRPNACPLPVLNKDHSISSIDNYQQGTSTVDRERSISSMDNYGGNQPSAAIQRRIDSLASNDRTADRERSISSIDNYGGNQPSAAIQRRIASLANNNRTTDREEDSIYSVDNYGGNQPSATSTNQASPPALHQRLMAGVGGDGTDQRTVVKELLAAGAVDRERRISSKWKQDSSMLPASESRIRPTGERERRTTSPMPTKKPDSPLACWLKGQSSSNTSNVEITSGFGGQLASGVPGGVTADWLNAHPASNTSADGALMRSYSANQETDGASNIHRERRISALVPESPPIRGRRATSLLIQDKPKSLSLPKRFLTRRRRDESPSSSWGGIGNDNCVHDGPCGSKVAGCVHTMFASSNEVS